jgi:phosphoserine aminotransferase
MGERFAKPAPSVREKRPSVSHRVDAAIRTAMAVEPQDRFQSAARFADAISKADVVAPAAQRAERSIAVLPFKNMSSDLEAEFFSEGITEDILNALARLPGGWLPTFR